MKNLKKQWIYSMLGVVIIASLLIGACAKPAPAPAPTPAPAEPIVWRLNNQYPATHLVNTLVLGPFADEITKATDGRLVLELHTAGELGFSGESLLRPIQAGLVEMTETDPNWTAGDLPIGELRAQPMAITSQEEMEAALMASRDEWAGEYFNWNAELLFFCTYGTARLFTTEKVTGIDDLEGLRVRANIGLDVARYTALGLETVVMPLGEVAPSLGRGLLDGVVTSANWIYSAKVYESGANFLNYDILSGPVAGAVIVSKVHWDKLSPDLQKIVKEVSAGWTHRALTEFEAENSARQKSMDDMGVMEVFYDTPQADLDQVRQAHEEVYSEYFADYSEVVQRARDKMVKAAAEVRAK